MTSSRSTPKATAKAPDEAERSHLTRDVVVGRALALADEAGLEAVTIRRLATELGVTPMALYWHFRGKDELLDGLVDLVWSEIDITVDPAAPWAGQLRRLMTSFLAVLRAHPAATPIIARLEKMHGPAAQQTTEVTLEVLRTAGFSPLDASMIARSAMWTGITLVMSEPGFQVQDEAERAEMQRRKQVMLATLPPSQFPRLVECAAPMTACDDPDLHYEFGVDLFMAGVTALAASRADEAAG